MLDKLKLLVAGLLVVAGIAGFYVFADSPAVVRVLSVLAGLILAAVTLWFTAPGKQFYAFSRESVTEAKKVVWPTRRETMQMTGVVIVFVIVMALFLWVVDGILFWLVQMVMDKGN